MGSTEYKYHPMHMHLHSNHQPGGSMEGHIYNASLLGMHYIRFTEHDSSTGRKKNAVDSFDFSKESLIYSDAPDCECGFIKKGEPQLSFENRTLNIRAQDEKAVGVELYSSAHRHTVSLLSEVTLTLGLDFNLPSGTRAIIEIRLSQRPPDFKYARYRIVFGELSQMLPPHTVEVKGVMNKDGIYILELSKLIGPISEIGGLDNAFDTVTLLVEGENAEIAINRLEIDAKYQYDEVIKRQRELADEIGKRYNIKPFVTTEISGAGNHKNCFSTCVPVINYEERGYSVTSNEAIEHVKRHGGIFAYNHPFECFKKIYKSGAEKEELNTLAKKFTDELIQNRALGATLIEVGFIEGRCGYSLADHLRLWDDLALAGVILTGYGDSDSHHNDKKWFSGSNFASYIAADSSLSFPIDEDIFIQSMKAGRVYTADPVIFKGNVSFTCEGREMGSVIVSEADKVCKLRVSMNEGWTLKVTTNKEYTEEITANQTGEIEIRTIIPSSQPISLTRVELYNENGRCIMLTNPIYLVNPSKYYGEIAKERLDRL